MMNFRKNSGFSLLEAVIYLAIIGLSLTAIISIALNIVNIKAKAGAQAEVSYNLGFAADQLKILADQSGGIDFGDSLLDSDSGRLSLFNIVSSGPPTVIYLDAVSGRLKIDDGDGVENLTTEQVIVSRFILRRLSTSTASMEMRVAARVPIDSGPYYQAEDAISQVLRAKRYCQAGICP